MGTERGGLCQRELLEGWIPVGSQESQLSVCQVRAEFGVTLPGRWVQGLGGWWPHQLCHCCWLKWREGI